MYASTVASLAETYGVHPREILFKGLRDRPRVVRARVVRDGDPERERELLREERVQALDARAQVVLLVVDRDDDLDRRAAVGPLGQAREEIRRDGSVCDRCHV